ncbi:MAG: site-2 protease family protein [Lachnospiraceae bacterium]|nr:site-2 protease family protein [Lachnospiraceae bacterium]
MVLVCLFIILFLIVASLILHETGHLLAAKLIGLPIERFTLGVGKPLFKKKIGGLDLAIAPLPFGASVTHKTEDIKKLKWGPHMLFLVSGCLMNFIFGYILILIALSHRDNPFILTSEYIINLLSGLMNNIILLFSGQLSIQSGNISEGFSNIAIAASSVSTDIFMQIKASMLIGGYMSIILGIGNLLPIPSLDGGQMITESLIRIGNRKGHNFRPVINKINNFCFLGMMIGMLFLFIFDLL